MISLEVAVREIANGQRICPRCGEEIRVDSDELNIHRCLPAPELDQGKFVISIGGAQTKGHASVIGGRKDTQMQKAVRLMREKFHLHKVGDWSLIQIIVP